MSPRIFARDPLADVDLLIPRVYRYVAYRLGDGPDAEDVTSEVFERAIRYRKSYQRASGEPIAWLLGIARRCTADAVVARSQPATEVIDTAANGNLEGDTLRRLVVAQAVSQLGSRDRELIALRYGADLSAAQIGILLGERTNTVEVALHRVLDRLRPVFTEQDLDPRAG